MQEESDSESDIENKLEDLELNKDEQSSMIP